MKLYSYINNEVILQNSLIVGTYGNLLTWPGSTHYEQEVTDLGGTVFTIPAGNTNSGTTIGIFSSLPVGWTQAGDWSSAQGEVTIACNKKLYVTNGSYSGNIAGYNLTNADGTFSAVKKYRQYPSTSVWITHNGDCNYPDSEIEEVWVQPPNNAYYFRNYIGTPINDPWRIHIIQYQANPTAANAPWPWPSTDVFTQIGAY